MSRIDDLIAELAPEGVRYVAVADLFELRTGYTPSKADASLWTDGTVPWFRMEDIRANGRVLADAIQRVPLEAIKGARLFPANSILVATSATIGEHALITVPHFSNQRFTSMALRQEYRGELEIKFVYYYCFILNDWCRANTTTSSFASVDMNGFKKFRFPVPPLQIQREIVRVLDKFTRLAEELNAELEMRLQQRRYYSARLLKAASQQSETVPLGTVADVNWGDTATTKRSYVDSGRRYLAYSAAGPDGYLDHFDYDRTAVVVSAIGALAGKTWRANGKWSCIKNTMRVYSRDESVLLTDYLYWLTAVPNFWPRRGSAQPFITKGDAEAIPVRIPPLAMQKRIVGLLDGIEALVSDPVAGLNAEAATRRKQYEHYRDRLLTFKELAA